MMLTQNRLSGLPEIANTDMSLEHRLLKDRAADTLRDVGARLIAAGIIERAPDPASLLVAANN